MSALSLDKIIGWDVYNWSGCLPFWLNDLDIRDKRILALGEREGGLSLLFASKGAEVVCSDFGGIKEKVIDEHRAYPFAERITYANINIFCIPYEDHAFDIVVCKSVIGGLKLNPKEVASRTLANQKLAMSEIQRVLKRGGYFLGAENMKGAHFIQEFREWYKKGKVGWRHLSVSELDFLLADFDLIAVKYFGLLPGLLRYDFLNIMIHKLNKAIATFSNRVGSIFHILNAKKHPLNRKKYPIEFG